MAATSGDTAYKNSWLEEFLLPWWDIFKKSTSLRLKLFIISISFSYVQSPVNKNDLFL